MVDLDSGVVSRGVIKPGGVCVKVSSSLLEDALFDVSLIMDKCDDALLRKCLQFALSYVDLRVELGYDISGILPVDEWERFALRLVSSCIDVIAEDYENGRDGRD